MTVVVARDESTASHIVFPWPDPVPWGAELVCSDDEVAIICPNWQIGEQLGPGRHTISPPNPQSHILAYFVRTTPEIVSFEQSIAVIDRNSNQTVPVWYEGRAEIQVGDPTLMCHQLVGLPYYDLATGILRSAQRSLAKVFQHVITKVCMTSPSVLTIASPDAVNQLVQMSANANPMAIAVTGLELVRFEEFRLSVDGDDAIEWESSSPDEDEGKTKPVERVSGERNATTIRLGSPESPKKTALMHGPPPAQKRTPSDPGERNQSDKTLPAGSEVLVYGADGLWHAATVRQYSDGRYQVSAEGDDSSFWVAASQVRPR